MTKMLNKVFTVYTEFLRKYVAFITPLAKYLKISC